MMPPQEPFQKELAKIAAFEFRDDGYGTTIALWQPDKSDRGNRMVISFNPNEKGAVFHLEVIHTIAGVQDKTDAEFYQFDALLADVATYLPPVDR